MSGLKSMENGALGEARAKALLLERFWVLERSIDIHGADYLVQRRLLDSNFMDKSPPKLGVIQAKYVQNGDTYISIPKHYVYSADSRIFGEFFVLVFTGRESTTRTFLLSAADLVNISEEKTKNEKTNLIFKASKLLSSSNLEIIDIASALDKIDHALRLADFSLNRMLLSTASYIKLDSSQIDHDLALPLDNSYANIRDEFYEQKKNLQRTPFLLGRHLRIIP